jgi:acetyl-CoA synthase
MASNYPQIPGARKKGVLLLNSEDDFKKLDSYLINDTVCIDGPVEAALRLAKLIYEKYKVEVKVVNVEGTWPLEELGQCGPVAKLRGCSPGSEIINSPIQEIVGEGRAEAVKFKDGKAIGVCLVLFMDKMFFDQPQEAAMVEGNSDLLIQLGTKGAQTILNLTGQSLASAISQKGQDAEIKFPETNYYLPLINALLNIEVKTLKDCSKAFAQAQGLADNQAADSGLIINSLGGILNKGVSTLICEEILAALAVLNQDHPKEGIGFIPDNILRSLGLQLVDGRISGIAVILGPAKDEQAAVELIRNFQSKSIVSLLAGNINGTTFRQQLQNQGIELGLENYIVPLGDDYLSAIYAVNFAVRAPLIYGGNKPGQWEGAANYIRNRVPAFVLLLSHIDEVLVATGLGVLAFGLPIITDLEVPQLGKIDTTLFEALVTEKDYQKLPSKCILTRGIKVKMVEVAVPVPYAAAFEGERVRKEQLAVEFGGKASKAFEFLSAWDQDNIDDGKVELIGPDIDQLTPGSKSLPLAIVVQVFGRKMQKDFEPILERQIHRFINYAMGLMHMGQRDMVWIRISKDAYDKGFRLKHLGVILHAMLHQEYSAIVDKVQVKLYTKEIDVDKLSLDVQKTYNQRDERLAGMTDESVDTFYSCLLCQSFAPNHVCIVTPERLGLCGAYSWLDAKASFEITPTGPNQPILKGNILDSRLGQWDNVNEFVQQKSNHTIDKVSMYSLMDGPQSSCGCFECIVAIIPEANGVMIVHRDYSGITPSGMSFTTLAGSVGGGVQTPGFLGVGKLYILSNKFISAEGGLKRVVWMPKELKEILGEKLRKVAQEIGGPDLLDKIADESVATSSEELLIFLEKVKHPALTMDPII